MKLKYRKTNSALVAVLILMILITPLSVIAQDNLEIKNFNQSFTFNNTYTINLETKTNSEVITNVEATADFEIDKNGNGTIEFKTFKSTRIIVNYSQIKATDGMIYWNFGGTHSEKQVKIQMTLEINPESNTVQSLVVYDEGIHKAFVFF